jgi:two-component system LytT family response regulator
MKLKCLIIDDEPDAIRLLEKVLTDFCSDKTELLGTASNSIEGMRLINKFRPDLLFLDIEMPGASGFDLIDIHRGFDFKVVFVTAYDKHALRAIRYKPDGYLLKPIDVGELIETVNTIYQEKTTASGAENLASGKYSISVKDQMVLVNYEEIIFIRADGRYSDICLVGDRIMKVCKNLGHVEKELLSKGFVRCHKSYLVNPKHIVRLNKTDGGFIEMSNGTAIEISRRRKSVLFG